MLRQFFVGRVLSVSSDKSGSDTGSGSESATIFATVTDSGSGTDTGDSSNYATDSGGGTETGTVDATLTVTDAGSGDDTGSATGDGVFDESDSGGLYSETVSLVVSTTESGSGTESATILLSATDTGSGSDVLDLVAYPASGDAGRDAGGLYSEVLSISASDTATDSGTGADSVTVLLTGTDSGSGSETGALTIACTDTGSGTESWSIAATLTATDTGTGVDVHSIDATYTLTDTGSGAESWSISATLASTDTGSGADTDANNLAGTDTGSGAESLSWSAAATVSDTGHGTESTSIGIVASDTGSGSETLSCTATMSISDSGSGSEPDSSNAAYWPTTDTGHGVDAFSSIAAVLTATDAGTGAETWSIAASLLQTELGHGTDTARFKNVVLCQEVTLYCPGEISLFCSDSRINLYGSQIRNTQPDSVQFFVVADSGVGSENQGVAGQSIAWTCTDTGTGADVGAVVVVVLSAEYTVTDTGTGAELATVTSSDYSENIFGVDSGHGVDAVVGVFPDPPVMPDPDPTLTTNLSAYYSADYTGDNNGQVQQVVPLGYPNPIRPGAASYSSSMRLLTPSKVGKGIYLGKTSDYSGSITHGLCRVTYDSGLPFNAPVAGYTLALWFKPVEVSAQTEYTICYYNHYGTIVPAGSVRVYFKSSDLRPRLRIVNSVGTTFEAVGVAPLAVDAWKLLTWHVDFTGLVAGIAIDGQPAATTGFVEPYDFAANANVITLLTPTFGPVDVFTLSPVNLGGTDAYRGWLDEIGYWRGRILTQADRVSLWNAGAGRTYPFA